MNRSGQHKIHPLFPHPSRKSHPLTPFQAIHHSPNFPSSLREPTEGRWPATGCPKGEAQRKQTPLHATHHSPLTTHHSPLTTHHSPLTTQHSPLTTHHSPLTTHHSPLTTHHSPLTTHHSTLNTHHSPLTTPPSPFFLPPSFLPVTSLLPHAPPPPPPPPPHSPRPHPIPLTPLTPPPRPRPRPHRLPQVTPLTPNPHPWTAAARRSFPPASPLAPPRGQAATSPVSHLSEMALAHNSTGHLHEQTTFMNRTPSPSPIFLPPIFLPLSSPPPPQLRSPR
jgi:hypothetical protein